MIRFRPAIAVWFILLVHGPASGALSSNSYIAGSFTLTIDGVYAGFIDSVEGGDPQGTVSVVSSNAAGPEKKSLNGITYAPIVVVLKFPLTAPVLNWIGDFCANGQQRRTVLINQYNINHQQEGAQLEAKETALAEVRFPALDAANPAPPALHLTLVLVPASTTELPPGPGIQPTGSGPTGASTNNFRVAIDGLDATKISQVAAFTIRQPDLAVAARSTAKDSGSSRIPNLVFTLPPLAADWLAWRDDFVIKGNNGDPQEKNGSLTLLGANAQTPVFTLQFSHLGLVRYSRLASSQGGVAKAEAELYCEGMSVTPATAASTSTKKGVVEKSQSKSPAATTGSIPSDATKQDEPSSEKKAEEDPESKKGGADVASDPKSAAADPTSEEKKDGGLADGGKAGSKDEASNDAKGGPNGTAASDKADSKTGDVAEETKQGESPEATKSDGKNLDESKDGGSASGGKADPKGEVPNVVSQTKLDPATPTRLAPAVSATPGKRSLLSVDSTTHDIGDFPKPAGAVKKSYNVYHNKTNTQESGAYSAPGTAAEVSAFYAKALQGSGWTEVSRMEDTSSPGNLPHVTMNWKKDPRYAGITITELKSGGVEIRVSVGTSL